MSEKEFLGDQPGAGEGGDPAPEPKKEEAVAKSGSDYTEFLSAIVNPETGQPKYKTVAEALFGAVHAQEHIRNLETENAELREKASKATTAEQVIEKVRQTNAQGTPEGSRASLDEKSVLEILEKRDKVQVEKSNRLSVLNTLKVKYGDKLEDALSTKAAELGLSAAELGSLAARSPKAVLAYFDVKGTGTPSNKEGVVNTDALRPIEPGKAAAPANLLWGASSKEQVEFLRKIKAEVE